MEIPQESVFQASCTHKVSRDSALKRTIDQIEHSRIHPIIPSKIACPSHLDRPSVTPWGVVVQWFTCAVGLRLTGAEALPLF